MGLFSNPAKDAKVIQQVIDYRILKAAWDSYAMIDSGKLVKIHQLATPAWFALFSIQNYKGDFTAFDVEERHLLAALAHPERAYQDILATLEANVHNLTLARYILNSHPNLQQAVPAQFDNAERINEYILRVVKKYVYLLTAYYKKYQKKIDAALQELDAKKNAPEEVGFIEEELL